MAEGDSNAGQLSSSVLAMSLGTDSSEEDYDADDVDESSGEEDEDLAMTLGFVQPVKEPWKMARHHFPSKVGGTPAWLDPLNLPEGESSLCGICGNPLGFLMQVYAAIEDNDVAYREEVFHRTLFLFVCSDMACLQQDQHHQLKKSAKKPHRSVKVFRSQLPRTNRFYDYHPASKESLPITDGAPMCTWCGTWKATNVCGGCKQVQYCTRSHQLAHWRGGHDIFCRSAQAELASQSRDATRDAVQAMVQEVFTRVRVSSGIVSGESDKLWPEMELTVGEEEELSSPTSNVPTTDAQQLLEEYERRRVHNGEEFSATDMQDVDESCAEQQHWAAFQARLSKAPDQVLRHCRAPGAKPLWPSLDGQPKEGNVPPCANCGGPRMFEFQLLPQLLYFLGVQNETENDSLDWATIAVYSCAASCSNSNLSSEGYVEDFPWVQLAVT